MLSFVEVSKLKVVYPNQIEEELHLLFDEVQKIKPKVILEIGVENGGTAFFWLSILKETNGIYIGIDVDPTVVKRTSYLLDRFGSSFNLIIGNSVAEETKERVNKILDKKSVDFLFIDGDHSFNAVKFDYEAYKPLVRSGGIIAFHDILPREGGVGRFWLTELKEKNKIEIIKSSTNKYGIGVIYKP